MDANHFGSGKADNCDVLPAVDRQTYQRTIGGSDATTYDVKLHIRGLTEPNIYTGGMLSTAQRFYIGGATTQTGYTAYSLTVADPPKVYFFNYNSSVGHFVFSLVLGDPHAVFFAALLLCSVSRLKRRSTFGLLLTLSAMRGTGRGSPRSWCRRSSSCAPSNESLGAWLLSRYDWTWQFWRYAAPRWPYSS